MPEQPEEPERMSAGAGQHPAAPWQWRRAVHRSEVQEWDSVYVQLPAFFRAGSCIFSAGLFPTRCSRALRRTEA